MATSSLSLQATLGLALLVLVIGRLLVGLIKWALQPSLQDARADRQPMKHGWLARRLDGRHLAGLPLTALVISVAIMTGALLCLIVVVVHEQPVTLWDAAFNRSLMFLRHPRLLHLLSHMTYLGDIVILLTMTLVAFGFLWVHGRRQYIPGLLVSVGGTEVVTAILKYSVGRARPEFLTFATASSPSFPSSHSSAGVAVYGFIVYTMVCGLTRPAQRLELAYWGAGLILGLAASRLLLSVHYLTDVAAGLLIGGIWLLIGIALTEYRKHREPAPTRLQPK